MYYTIRRAFIDIPGIIVSYSFPRPFVPKRKELLCSRDLKANERLYSYHVERCNALARKQTFFTTKKGWLGTGLPSIGEGDMLALLAGLGCPIILRKSEGREIYEVVGVAYIEGMMRGRLGMGMRGPLGSRLWCEKDSYMKDFECLNEMLVRDRGQERV